MTLSIAARKHGVSLPAMKSRLFVFVSLIIASFLLTPFLPAQDTDKDVDDAIQEATESAKKMGVKMPDVKKQFEEVGGRREIERSSDRTNLQRREIPHLHPLPFGKGEERRTTTGTCRYARRMRALPISQRQKLFAHYLIVFDGVDAHLGHLHSFL